MPPKSRKRKASCGNSQTRKKSRATNKPTPRTNSRPERSLETLPKDLLLRIISNLQGYLRSLKALSETSRFFNEFTNPFLYQTYHSFDHEPYTFLRAIMSNPKLAAHVRIMDIDYAQDAFHFRKPFKKRTGDLGVFNQGFKKLGLPDWEDWARKCNEYKPLKDQEPMLYAAMLLHTRGIAELKIDDRSESSHKINEILTKLINKERYGKMHRFTKLQSASFAIHNEHAEFAAPIFQLESLRKLEISCLHDAPTLFDEEYSEQQGSDPPPLVELLPPGSSNIEELQIKASDPDVSTIAVMLDSIRCLKRLTLPISSDELKGKYGYRHADWFDWMSTRPDFPYNPKLHHPGLLQALLAHHETLESLELDDEEGGYNGRGGTTNILIGKGMLKWFKRLKHLTAPFGTILGTRSPKGPDFLNEIPESLESLHLVVAPFTRGDPHEWSQKDQKAEDVRKMEPIEYLAENFRHRLKRLETVKVECRIAPHRFNYNWDRLRIPFVEQDVEFSFTHMDPSSSDRRFGSGKASTEAKPWWPESYPDEIPDPKERRRSWGEEYDSNGMYDSDW